MLWLFGYGESAPEVQGAFLRGALNFLGVLITGGIAIFTWWRNRERDRHNAQAKRDQKRIDLLRALRSDIQPVWIDLYTQGTLEAKQKRVTDAFAQARADRAQGLPLFARKTEPFTPFVTRVAGTLFSERLAQDVVFLRSNEIEAVVAVYHQIRAINEVAGDMRTKRYGGLPIERKELVLLDLLKMEDTAMKQAKGALEILEKTLDLHEDGELPSDRLKRRLDAKFVQ